MSVPPDVFARLAPREQATVMRLLLEASDAEAAALLAPRAAPGLATMDLHAEALLSLGRHDEALSIVAQRETGRVSSISLGLRTRALAHLGRMDEARAALGALDEPEGYLARTMLGEALLAAGDAAGARDVLAQAVAQHPERRRALMGLVQAHDLLGDFVTGSAYAARLLDTQGEEEGPLSAKYLARLRGFYARGGETNRLAEIDAALVVRREEAAARLEALLSGAPAPPRAQTRSRPAPATPVVAEALDEPPAPPVSQEALDAAEALVRRHVGFPSLRPGQAETIARGLRGEDVLAILPTGGGKSICYQLPAVLSPGVTLVVSPLIALMKDQLDALPPAMRAASAALTSELGARESRRVLDEVRASRYRMLYVAPERLRQPSLLAALRQGGVDRLVVDEAHCVSVWGHDFRPDYLGIADARRALGNPPVLAVTATAPPRVARDILQRLGPMSVVRASVERPNLRFEAVLAKDADEKLAHLLALCRETKGPGIVYASSRVKCEQLAQALVMQGVDAQAYHAGMPDRGSIQEAFMRGDVSVLVATVAFGMGIDKGDIRFVFHHDPASSVENYYQESGRAGRDGKPARCVVLATAMDGGTLKQRAKGDLPSRDLVGRAWQLVVSSTDEDKRAVLDFDAISSIDSDERSDVKPRVALSVLAEAGAIERLADVPRSLVLAHAPETLRMLQGRDVSIFEVAARLGVAPEDAEAALAAMPEARFETRGRAMLYRVHGDVANVETVLDRYAALATQRGKEMMDYVRAEGCRHAYLRAYFGEHAPGTCKACDNCLGLVHEAASLPGGDEEDAARGVLEALASMRGIGELNLVWLLRGDARAPEWVAGHSHFGRLGFRSESKLKALVRGLERAGHVERQRLEHGGQSLRITQSGLKALGGDAPLATQPPRAATASREQGEAHAPPDGAAHGGPVFEALRAWRRERASADGVPPYVVASDATLRAIVEAHPTDVRSLQDVKGMGPKRVEKYGEDLLAVLRTA